MSIQLTKQDQQDQRHAICEVPSLSRMAESKVFSRSVLFAPSSPLAYLGPEKTICAQVMGCPEWVWVLKRLQSVIIGQQEADIFNSMIRYCDVQSTSTSTSTSTYPTNVLECLEITSDVGNALRRHGVDDCLQTLTMIPTLIPQSGLYGFRGARNSSPHHRISETSLWMRRTLPYFWTMLRDIACNKENPSRMAGICDALTNWDSSSFGFQFVEILTRHANVMMGSDWAEHVVASLEWGHRLQKRFPRRGASSPYSKRERILALWCTIVSNSAPLSMFMKAGGLTKEQADVVQEHRREIAREPSEND